MEDFDAEVEWAMIHGIPVDEHLADLRLQPIKEGSRLTNDPLQILLARYANEVARTGKVMHNLGRRCDGE
jgi:hypothetical protein